MVESSCSRTLNRKWPKSFSRRKATPQVFRWRRRSPKLVSIGDAIAPHSRDTAAFNCVYFAFLFFIMA